MVLSMFENYASPCKMALLNDFGRVSDNLYIQLSLYIKPTMGLFFCAAVYTHICLLIGGHTCTCVERSPGVDVFVIVNDESARMSLLFPRHCSPCLLQEWSSWPMDGCCYMTIN